MGDTLLSIRDLHTYLGDSYVIQGVDLEISAGKLVALLGRNGMGKTTLIRSILNLAPASRGTITFRSENLVGMAPYRIAQMRIGLVPQGRRIFPSLTVRENLNLPTSAFAGGRQRGGAWSLDRVYQLFPRLSERSRQLAGSLSGGEQSMLAIGRALMSDPELLLMDEPSEGLAPVIVGRLGQIISELRKDGLSILLVEQNIPFAIELADEVNILANGKTVFHGSPGDFEADHDAKQRWLGV